MWICLGHVTSERPTSLLMMREHARAADVCICLHSACMGCKMLHRWSNMSLEESYTCM